MLGGEETFADGLDTSALRIHSPPPPPPIAITTTQPHPHNNNTESTVGIEIGARTGLAAVASACGFLLSIVLNPILSSIPPYATGAALVLIGCILMEHLSHIDWRNRRSALGAFLTVVLMPFTYSIAYGVMGGILVTVVMRLLFLVLDWVEARWCRRGKSGSRKKAGEEEDGAVDSEGGNLLGHAMAEMPPPEGLEDA